MKVSRKDKIYISVICVLFAMILITVTHIILRNESVEEWFSESIIEGDYVVSGTVRTERGDAVFKRPTEVSLSVWSKNNHHTLSLTTRVDNKGKVLTKDNYKIESNEEYIKVELIDYKGKVKGYRFFFEDFY